MSRGETAPRVAVVTGGHNFDVPGFHALWRALAPEVDAYVQHLDDFCSAPEPVRAGYDVVLFYTMMREAPTDQGLPWYAGRPLTALSQLGAGGQGIVLLHHALVAYPDWAPWRELSGLAEISNGYHYDQTVTTHIADPTHPITAGLSGWTMVDETYTTPDAGEGNQVLLTYDQPRSMKTIAWVRGYRESRVFCYQAGHDAKAWADPHFQQVLTRGIRWAAHRL